MYLLRSLYCLSANSLKCNASKITHKSPMNVGFFTKLRFGEERIPSKPLTVIAKRFFNSQENKNPMKLMDFPYLIWPHPIKSIKNLLFGVLIRGYFDPSFSRTEFLRGAEMAICNVSSSIQNGQFEKLDGLVDHSALNEIKSNYDKLNSTQKSNVSAKSEEFFLKYIYEIGVIFDDTAGKRFVEITTVFQGIHGAFNPNINIAMDTASVRDNCYVCNYRFIKEFTKGVDDSWLINKLNHFHPAEYVDQSSPPFIR